VSVGSVPVEDAAQVSRGQSQRALHSSIRRRVMTRGAAYRRWACWRIERLRAATLNSRSLRFRLRAAGDLRLRSLCVKRTMPPSEVAPDIGHEIMTPTRSDVPRARNRTSESRFLARGTAHVRCVRSEHQRFAQVARQPRTAGTGQALPIAPRACPSSSTGSLDKEETVSIHGVA